MARTTYDVHEILERSVQMTADCWLWQKVVVRGYGQVTYNKKAYRAHRLIYELLVGEIPEGLELDHLCRNQLCVNPNHLEPVTQRENILRGESVAAKNARKTHCKEGHEFTEENTYHPPKYPSRRNCRRCQLERHLTWRLSRG